MKQSRFDKFFVRIAWIALTSVATYTAHQLSNLTDSVASLNTNVAVMVEKVSRQDEVQKDFKSSLDSMKSALENFNARIIFLEHQSK